MKSRRPYRLMLTTAAALGVCVAFAALPACDDGVLAPGRSRSGALTDAAATAVDASQTGDGNSADAGGEGPSKVAMCPPPAFEACPGPVPSFAATILPIFDASCNTCHDPTVPNGPWPFSDHGDVVAWKDSIIAELFNCTMPPADAEVALSETDRQQIFTWIVCGAPDN